MGLQERIAPHATEPLPGTRVLIVEDQPFVAMAVADMVESLGGVVAAVAATVPEGLASCQAVIFDVALLDIDLEGETSAPVARALSDAGKPFLLVTGFDRRLPGFEDVPVLMKPYAMRALREGLFSLLD